MVKTERRCYWFHRHKGLHNGSSEERDQFVLEGKIGKDGVEGVDLMPRKLSENVLHKEKFGPGRSLL